MITAGIDAGSRQIKVVILKDNQLLSSSISDYPLEMDTNAVARRTLLQTLEKEGIAVHDIWKMGVTGAGRDDIAFAEERFTEVACDARGSVWLHPSTRTVIDLGAEQCRGVKCDADGHLLNFALNDKCAAGAGIFLETMAKVMRVPLEEIGNLSLGAKKEIVMNTTCVVFAESEMISLRSSGQEPADILRAVHVALATRAASTLRHIGPEKDVMFVGGVAKNPGIVHFLKKELSLDIVVPQSPQIVGALGAALLAGELGR